MGVRREGVMGAGAAKAAKPRLTPSEFQVLAQYLYEVSGIHLDPGKAYLVETRLGHMLEELGCASYSEFLYRLKQDRSKSLVHRFVDAMTTNETLFFRDTGPFDLLRYKLLPDLIDRKTSGAVGGLRPTIRIWSAACSFGQEVYSVAIVCHEVLQHAPGVSVKILGTDISSAAVGRASTGKYSAFEVERGLPPGIRDRYFQKVGHSTWKISDEIRAMCQFKKLNLLEPFGFLGRFDIVLCRNVAIYFKPEDRKNLYERLADSLEPWGALLIGASEFLTGVTQRFTARRHLRHVYYVRTDP